jgi:uncharacterized protein HemX
MIEKLGAKIIAILILAAFVIGLAWFGLTQWRHARTAATESRLQQNQGTAAVESAKDAIATQGAAAARETASEALTAANEKEIRNAKGSDAAVDPAVRDAGLAGLCRRAAYRGDKRCLRFTPTR